MGDAFYDRIDADEQGHETFRPTDHVLSPWGAHLQHGGPVAGLLVRAMDRLEARLGTRIAKVTVDLLGPVPVEDVRVAARIERPGRRITLLSATLDARSPDGSWRPTARATAWRLATQPTSDVARSADAPIGDPPASGADLRGFDTPESWQTGGFVGAITWNVARAGEKPGEPSIAWMNLSRPLVEGESTSPVENVATLADTANGVGARLDPYAFSFLNTDVSLNLFQPPTGEWFGLEAETSVGGDGVAMSSAVVHDRTGPIGRIAQTVLVERRGSADG